MKSEHDPGPLTGMYACDADLFCRVWDRVSTAQREDSLVEVHDPTVTQVKQTAQDLPQPEQIIPTETPLQNPVQEPQDHSVPWGTIEDIGSVDTAEDDFPSEDDLPCLGRGSAAQESQLQQYIREELEGWQFYRHLARRINGPNARALAALASEKHRCAKRLAAAHFLIAGVRYWPTDKLETPKFRTWLGALRERFNAEQRHEHRYRAAACELCDPCLRELYTELAEASANHAVTIRTVLESAL